MIIVPHFLVLQAILENEIEGQNGQDEEFSIGIGIHMSNVAELVEAVERKYGLETESTYGIDDRVRIYLGMLGTINKVCRNLSYGSHTPASVNDISGNLARLLIDVVRLQSYRPQDSRLALPRTDMPAFPPDAFVWASEAMGAADEFLLYSDTSSAARNFSTKAIGLIDDTARGYGMNFAKIMDIALTKV